MYFVDLLENLKIFRSSAIDLERAIWESVILTLIEQPNN